MGMLQVSGRPDLGTPFQGCAQARDGVRLTHVLKMRCGSAVREPPYSSGSPSAEKRSCCFHQLVAAGRMCLHTNLVAVSCGTQEI